MANTDLTVDAPLTRQKSTHFRVASKSIGVRFQTVCGAGYDPAHSTTNADRVTCKRCLKSALVSSIKATSKDA